MARRRIRVDKTKEVSSAAGVAGGAIGGRSRVGLRSAGVGGVLGGRRPRGADERRRGGGDDAGATVLVEGTRRDAELPCAGAAAHPGGEQFGGLVGHLGVDDGTSAPPARLEEDVFAVLPIASDGARDGGARDLEGAHDVGLADTGDDVQLGGAEQHGAAVVGGVAIEGFEVEEVVSQAVVGLHGVAVADGSGVRRGEREGEDHGLPPNMYHRILSTTETGCQGGIGCEDGGSTPRRAPRTRLHGPPRPGLLAAARAALLALVASLVVLGSRAVHAAPPGASSILEFDVGFRAAWG